MPDDRAPDDTDRPATTLAPSARLLWRSDRSVQLEIGARRVLIDGVAAPVVGELVGRRRGGGAARSPATLRLQEQLTRSGFLWPRMPRDGEDDPRLVTSRPQLAGELAALSARHGQAAAEVLSARAHASVAIHGTSRIGPLLAALLAASGVGATCVADRRPARLAHALPGGVLPSEEGQPLAEAAEHAIARVAPTTDTTPPRLGEAPDLIVLATDEPVDPERREALHAQRAPHLLVSLQVDQGVVGPLVLPGLTSCLGCADLHRLDRDPAWNALAVQLSVRSRVAASADAALATLVAGLAALEILAFLDGNSPATVEGSLEVHAADRRIRRRSWPVHPDCTCMLA